MGFFNIRESSKIALGKMKKVRVGDKGFLLVGVEI